jgi:hypothetical protein
VKVALLVAAAVKEVMVVVGWRTGQSTYQIKAGEGTSIGES